MERFEKTQAEFLAVKTRGGAQTMQSHVIVPILQNVIGGLSLGLLYFFWLSKGVFYFTSPHIATCIILGLSVAMIFNVLRFFGDDLKLYYLAFRMGQFFVINKRENKLAAATIKELSGITDNVTENALKLLVASYDAHMDITEKNASQNFKMTRRQFEDARGLLIKKQLLRNAKANRLTPPTKSEALEVFRRVRK